MAAWLQLLQLQRSPGRVDGGLGGYGGREYWLTGLLG